MGVVRMLRFLRRLLFHPAAALAVALMPINALSTSAAWSAPAYVAGSANAFAPTHDAATWTENFHCSFAGWAHVTVNWSCRLKDPTYGVYYSTHTGSFSKGYATTSTFSYTIANTYLCTLAYAAYQDGSASDDDTACNG